MQDVVHTIESHSFEQLVIINLSEMTVEEITKRSHEIILSILPGVNPEQLSSESDVFNLGLDSITAMTLVLKLQAAFDIQFEVSEISLENFKTPGHMIELLRKKKGL